MHWPAWMRDHTHTKSSASTAKAGWILTACFFAFCILNTLTIELASAQPTKNIMQQTYQRLRLIAEASLKADEKLLLQLEDTKKRLAKLCANKVYPSLHDDIVELQSQLNETLEENPYIGKDFETESGINSQELPVNREKARIKVSLDPSISESLVQKWSENPPTSINNRAGTICVLTNGFDLAILYVSSLEGSPCKDAKTGKPRILSLRIIPDPKSGSGYSPALN